MFDEKELGEPNVGQCQVADSRSRTLTLQDEEAEVFAAGRKDVMLDVNWQKA
jgi:hypothetical protein